MNDEFVHEHARICAESLLEEEMTDEERIDSRSMVDQSPYVINAGLAYINAETGWESNFAYNVQGKRIVVVGAGSLSDVYELPYNALGAKVSKRLKNGIKLSFSADNLLDDQREKQYEAFSGDIGTFELLRPGRTFSLGVSWNL